MMKSTVFLLIIITFQAAFAGDKMNTTLEWYRGNCQSAKIDFYKKVEDKKPNKTVAITDKSKIDQIVSLLGKIPTSGEKMIKISATASHMVLTLSCDGTEYEIKFYNDRIKTPDTSFLSSADKEELELVKLLKSLKP